MNVLSNLHNFDSDRSVSQLCEKVWKIEPVAVPKPALNAGNRVRSSTNLLASQDFNQGKGDSMIEEEDEHSNEGDTDKAGVV